MALSLVAKKAIKKCDSLGADEAEAFIMKRRSVEVVLERGEIQSERLKIQQGIGIRFIKDKKFGFSYSSMLDKKTLERICNVASKLAKNSPSNPDWISLPVPKRIPPAPKGIYDKEIANLSPEDILELVLKGYNAVKGTDDRASIDDGKFSAVTAEVAVANSHGIVLKSEGTAISFSLTCVAKENGEASSFAFEYDVSRELEGFNTEKVGELAARKAVDSLHAKAIQPFEGKLLMMPDVAAEVLFSTVSSAVNGDNVIRGRSLWANNIGELISNPVLNLIDNRLLPHGIGSSQFDAEGVPSQRTVLIDEGILKDFIYDSYSANKVGTDSTGNAVRGGYSSLPSVSISNLIVQPGKQNFDDLVSDINKGVVVNRFSGNINSQSGDFSGLVKQASYIENGEIKFPLKETMISGNVFETLKNIIMIGSEQRATMISIYTPPIVVKGIKIVSKH